MPSIAPSPGAEQSTATYQLAVDIGGTFTDIVVLGDGRELHTAKVLSTFDDLLRGIAAGLRDVFTANDIDPGQVGELVHASTVGTNTVLEESGAVTGLITTEGFRDVLEIGRLRRPTMYDPFWRKPPPMVPRRRRLEVRERVRADGSVIAALSDADVDTAMKALKELGAESVAVSLLHSYADPSHERRIGQAISDALPDVCVSLSHEVLPEIREYERTSTTVINAYIMPAITGYLDRLQEVLDQIGIEAPLRMMQSSGGIVSERTARRRPVSVVESGPAAGALATAAMADDAGVANAIAFDMGGTTAKASVIEDGAVEMAFEYEVGAGMSAASPLLTGGGYALRGPTVAIAEVGSGGGSIASVDAGGAVQVGPESASADPGPACYGRGGEEPTVTDANVVLGYLSPVAIAGGRLPIDRDRAVESVRTRLSEPLGSEVLDAAYGIHLIANENMARAIRAVTVERGRDPGDFDLVAFGGSGPMHAAGLAQAMGIRRVVIPVKAGLFSALGLLFAGVRNDGVVTLKRPLGDFDDDQLRSRFVDLDASTRQSLAGEAPVDVETLTASYAADLRYVGQSSEIVVSLPTLEGELAAALSNGFAAAYKRLYGRVGSGNLEIVSLRITLTAPSHAPRYRDVAGANREGGGVAESRQAYFGAGLLDAQVFAGRTALGDRTVIGPAIIEESDTTILVPPGASAALDAAGSVVISLEQGGTDR